MEEFRREFLWREVVKSLGIHMRREKICLMLSQGDRTLRLRELDFVLYEVYREWCQTDISAHPNVWVCSYSPALSVQRAELGRSSCIFTCQTVLQNWLCGFWQEPARACFGPHQIGLRRWWALTQQILLQMLIPSLIPSTTLTEHLLHARHHSRHREIQSWIK